jgi:hypothetical protein
MLQSNGKRAAAEKSMLTAHFNSSHEGFAVVFSSPLCGFSSDYSHASTWQQQSDFTSINEKVAGRKGKKDRER